MEMEQLQKVYGIGENNYCITGKIINSMKIKYSFHEKIIIIITYSLVHLSFKCHN